MKSTEFIEQAFFNETVLNSISDSVIATDLQGKIVFWNKAAEELYKWESKEVIGKDITEISPSNKTKKQAEEMMKSIKNGDSWEGEFDVQDKSGQIFPIHVKDSPFTDKKGNLAGIIEIARDIRESKIAEQAIKDIEERLNLIVNESPFPVVLADINDEKIIYWSESAKELTGYSPKTVTEWYKLAYPDEEYRKQVFERWKPFVEKAKESKQAINSGEYRITCKNGSLIDVEFYVQFIPGNMVVTFNDVTERKKVENALKKQNLYLEKLNNSLQSVVFTVDVETRKIEYVNNRVKAIFGYHPDECIENTTDFLYPTKEAFLDYGKQMQKAILNNQDFLRTENVLRRKNGELFDTDITTSFLNENKVVAVITDITDKKAAEKEIEIRDRNLKSLLENPAGYLIYRTRLNPSTKQTEVLAVSPSWSEVLGIPEENINDFQKWFEHVYPEDLPALMNASEEGMKPPFKLNIEFRHNHPTKGKRWLEIRSTGIPFDNNPDLIEYANGIILDITERKKAEQEIVIAKEKAEESEKQLRLISDNFVNGMIYQVAMLDEERRKFNYLSKNVEELYGCKPEEAKEDPNLIYGKIHPDDINGLIEKEASALKTMSTFETEARTFAPNGSIRWAYYISKPRIINGIVCWDGIEIDITERKKMELELISAKEKAEESDRLKTAFLANMSHEIRTPMNGILGFTSLLQKHDLTSEQQQDYIKIIKKSGDRMLTTVNDIIEISKIETGQITVTSTEVNISNHLKSLYEFFGLEANKKGLQLIIDNELASNESLIFTDKSKISSILTNLIKNAIKFTEKGTIKIGCKKNNMFLEMYVEDTGIGIPEDRIAAIFNRFEQADIEDKQVHEGSGLGLAITKSYVEMLGGKIWVESEKNNGSTFYFTIAYKPLEEEVSNSEVISNPPSEIDKKLNILIVEDDETSSLYLSTILKQYATNIQIENNGLKAVEYCKNNTNIDLVLMDLKLPVLDGYQATKSIREFNKEIIIIAQTAHVLEGDREKALEVGCNEYIGKPIMEKSLIELIQKFRSLK